MPPSTVTAFQVAPLDHGLVPAKTRAPQRAVLPIHKIVVGCLHLLRSPPQEPLLRNERRGCGDGAEGKIPAPKAKGSSKNLRKHHFGRDFLSSFRKISLSPSRTRFRILFLASGPKIEMISSSRILRMFPDGWGSRHEFGKPSARNGTFPKVWEDLRNIGNSSALTESRHRMTDSEPKTEGTSF